MKNNNKIINFEKICEREKNKKEKIEAIFNRAFASHEANQRIFENATEEIAEITGKGLEEACAILATALIKKIIDKPKIKE